VRNEAAAGEMGVLLEERRPVRRNGDGQELRLRRIQGVLRGNLDRPRAQSGATKPLQKHGTRRSARNSAIDRKTVLGHWRLKNVYPCKHKIFQLVLGFVRQRDVNPMFLQNCS